MKKTLKILLIPLLILILAVAAMSGYRALFEWNLDSAKTELGLFSEDLYTFTYMNRNDSAQVWHFDIPMDREVTLNAWTMNLWGTVRLSVIDVDNQTVFEKQLDGTSQRFKVHLPAGSYQVIATFDNAFNGGSVFGLDYERAYIAGLKPLPDSDGDGLPDSRETGIGSDPHQADSDGDTLSDYAEVVKYRTDPLKADSDRDGKPDSDWDERREFAYTVHARIKMQQPFDLTAMNDLYQDVRTAGRTTTDGYTLLDIVLYPETKAILNAAPYPLQDLPAAVMPYLKPGIGTNYNEAMEVEAGKIVHDAPVETDVQAVQKLLSWVNQSTAQYLDYSIPEVYFTYLETGTVKVRNYTDPLPVDELLRTHYFADSMFKERVHGTCTSVATLKCSMIRAAGIPCRMIQTIFPIYYHGDQTLPYENKLQRPWGCNFEQAAGTELTYANHAYLEVFLGGQWLRVDQHLGVYSDDPECLNLKIVSVADWSEVDFSQTWPVDWIDHRPYYTLLLEDSEPQHTASR